MDNNPLDLLSGDTPVQSNPLDLLSGDTPVQPNPLDLLAGTTPQPTPQVTSQDRNLEALARRAKANGITPEQQKAQEDAEPLRTPDLKPEPERQSRFRDFGDIAMRNATEARDNRNTQIRDSSAIDGLGTLLTNPILATTSLLSEGDNPVKDDLKDLGSTALGTLQSMGLFVSSAAEAFVGNPLADRMEANGGTPAFVNATRSVGTIGPELIAGFGGPALVKALASRGVRMSDKAKALDQAGEVDATAIADSPTTINPLASDNGDFDTVFSDRVIRNITDEAAQTLKGTPQKKQRLYLDIADSLRGVDESGARVQQLDAASIGQILERNGMDLETFVQVYKASVSGAGRTLARQSHASRALAKQLEESHPELANVLVKNADETATWGTNLFNAWRTTDTYRRLAGTGQLVTAVRNVAVSVPISGLMAIDNATEKLMLGGVNAKSAGSFMDTMGRYAKSFGAMTPNGQKKMLEALDKTEGFTSETITGGSGIADATIDSAAKKALSFFNMAQEKPLRMAAMQFKLTDMKGVNSIDDIDFAALTKEELEEATDYALTVTFAKDPESKFARQALQTFTDIGGTTIAPYPRFMFYNAPKWAFDHSPLGVARVFTPNNLQTAMKSGDHKKTAKILSEAMTGTVALSLALQRASGEFAGEKSQELATEDGGRVNLATFAPLSFYDTIAKGILNPDAFNVTDLAQMVTGLRTTRDTPVQILGELFDGDGKGAVDAAKRIAGNYIAMFSTPLRQVKDVVSIFDPEEAVNRVTKDKPLTGRLQNNIPFLSQDLPARRSLFESGPITPDKAQVLGLPDEIFGVQVPDLPANLRPVVAQIVPITKEFRPAVESELIRVGIEPYKMYPRTGIDQADDYIVREVGELADMVAEQYMWSDLYQNEKTKAGKAQQLSELFTNFGTMAKAKMLQENPELYGRMKLESQLTERQKQFFEQSGGVKQNDLNNFLQTGAPIGPNPSESQASPLDLLQ